MKTRMVLIGLLGTLLTVPALAQQGEYDDMYFRGKDREKNKAIEADASTKVKKQRTQNVPESVETEPVDDYSNPTDSYSARNVNPEFVSRTNSEQASEDETDYYVEDYDSDADINYNNSYYNNQNWARNSYYNSNFGWNGPSYGRLGFYDPWMMNPYSSFYYGNSLMYDPWMMGPSWGYPGYGWGSRWTVSVGYSWGNWGYGNGWGNPYWGGYGFSPYYGYGGYGNYYYEGSRCI